MISRVETRLNSLKDNLNSEKLSFFPKKERSIPLNFLFPLVTFIGVFSILKCKTLVLKTTNWCARQPGIFLMDDIYWGVKSISSPTPAKWSTWPLDVCGGGGYGWFWGNHFFPNLWTFFSLIWRCKIFFSALCVMSNIFFSAGYFLSQEFLCILFLSQNQSAGYFFSEITYKPLKTQIVGP